jgi:hypothetical protein
MQVRRSPNPHETFLVFSSCDFVDRFGWGERQQQIEGTTLYYRYSFVADLLGYHSLFFEINRQLQNTRS